jgi:GT2 family glycosyltransferase/glycosyltransferase involved in cell wall biosynthesis/2-polyprenyl-3-methyl-5-hydroxy-6-metoxy-1,4-benzoquinol methylase
MDRQHKLTPDNVVSTPECDIECTGERVVPGKVDPDLFNEHFARYMYARPYCSNRKVLDAGCGVGYGTAYLAEAASQVIGIDFDLEAIRYARACYGRRNSSYVVGDCQKLPFAPQSFDVIVSFELIEHLPDASSYLQEVQRVLKDGGIFVVSTPNRPVYHEHLGDVRNPFHVREWDHREFVALLKTYFPFVEVLAENHLSAVGIIDPDSTGSVRAEVSQAGPVSEAAYFVCLCSSTTQQTGNLVFIPSAANVLLERERHLRSVQTQLKDREAYLSRLQPEFEQMAGWATKLNADLANLQAEHAHLQAEAGELRHKTQELGALWSKATRWKRALVFLLLVPLDWAIGLLIIGAELLTRLLRRCLRPAQLADSVPDTSRCSVLIVTWEGKELLAESLPPLLSALKLHGGQHEVIVVDNGSTDGTQEFVNSNFPEVRVVRSQRNLYFGGGNNFGVREAHNDIVVLLNNDMIVHNDFLYPLLQPFQKGNVFAVASQVSLADPGKPREETGKTRASFNGCDFDWKHEPITPGDEQQQYVPVFWGHGGAVAVDRKKYLSLGGFDELYDPFYVEDADLSYQAWKLGWQCLLAVQSKVIHKHRSSTSRFGKAFITQIVRRNQQVFIWKNLSDINKLAAHFARAFRSRMRLAGIPGIGVQFELRAFLGAAKRLPTILRRRMQFASRMVSTDQEVLDLANQPSPRIVSSAEVDFSRPESDQQLGTGWHPVEEHGRRSYRWMGPQASVYLRAPSEKAHLLISGYVPSLSHYRASSLTLSVRCNDQLYEGALNEGVFELSFPVIGLETGCSVRTELALDHVIQPQGADTRTLGLMCNRITLIPVSDSNGGLPHHERLSDGVRPGDMVKTVPAPQASGQRRILMVCAYLPCLGVHSGGNTMFNLIRTLSKRHRLTVLSFYERDEEREQFVPLLSQYCERLEVIYRGQTFEVGNLLGLKPPEILHEFYHKRMQMLVREYLLSSHFDLLQCEYLQTGHFAYVDPGIPAVLTNHEVVSLSYANRFHALRWTSRGKFGAMIAWMRMLNYEEKLLRRFAGVMVLTRPEREFLARYAPDVRVYDHATGVDCDFYSPSDEAPEEGSIIFVGNFRHGPNVGAMTWFLDRVWPRIRALYRDARLYIVGGNPPPSLQQAHGREGIVVTGWVEDVRPYLQRSVVFVAPVFEGVGLRGKVLEAWAMRKPVVGTRLSFEALNARDGATCFIADDPEQFASRTCELLRHPELANKMGEAARELVVNSFSWDAFGDMYDKVYNDILSPRDHLRIGVRSSALQPS